MRSSDWSYLPCVLWNWEHKALLQLSSAYTPLFFLIATHLFPPFFCSFSIHGWSSGWAFLLSIPLFLRLASSFLFLPNSLPSPYSGTPSSAVCTSLLSSIGCMGMGGWGRRGTHKLSLVTLFPLENLWPPPLECPREYGKRTATMNGLRTISFHNCSHPTLAQLCIPLLTHRSHLCSCFPLLTHVTPLFLLILINSLSLCKSLSYLIQLLCWTRKKGLTRYNIFTKTRWPPGLIRRIWGIRSDLVEPDCLWRRSGKRTISYKSYPEESCWDLSNTRGVIRRSWMIVIFLVSVLQNTDVVHMPCRKKAASSCIISFLSRHCYNNTAYSILTLASWATSHRWGVLNLMILYCLELTLEGDWKDGVLLKLCNKWAHAKSEWHYSLLTLQAWLYAR